MTIIETITVAEDGIITLHAPSIKAGTTVFVTATAILTTEQLVDALTKKKRFEDLTEAELDAAYRDMVESNTALAATLADIDLPPDYSQIVKKLERI